MAKPTPHMQMLEELNAAVEGLKTSFQLYFMGLERFNPAPERDKLQKLINSTKRDASRWNTAERFRMNSIHQKFSTYNRMWTRSLTEMENGTFRIDRERVKRKRRAEEEAMAGAPAGAPQAAAAGPAAANGAARRPSGQNGESMPEERMRRLYNVYMQAKKRTGEKTNISYESLQAQINKQIPAIKRKHQCQNVDFKVVLKNGKAMLKAVPK